MPLLMPEWDAREERSDRNKTDGLADGMEATDESAHDSGISSLHEAPLSFVMTMMENHDSNMPSRYRDSGVTESRPQSSIEGSCALDDDEIPATQMKLDSVHTIEDLESGLTGSIADEEDALSQEVKKSLLGRKRGRGGSFRGLTRKRARSNATMVDGSGRLMRRACFS